MNGSPRIRIAAAGVAGGLIGALTALLLHRFADQPLGEEWVRADAIAAWLGIPVNHWLHMATGWDWGWSDAERPWFRLTALTLNGAFWSAGGAVVARRLRSSARFRRTLMVCAMITLPLAGLQWLVKIPGPTGNRSIVRSTVLLLHGPGLLLLGQVGLCCGYENSLVIRDWGDSEGYRPSALAVFLLFASNFVMYVVLACAGLFVRSRLRRRRSASVAPG